MATRILFVLPDLGAGGAERVVTHLLAALPRERFEPHLALVARRGPWLERVPADVPVHDLGARRVRWAPLPLVRAVRRLRPRVVFSTLGYLNLAVIPLRAAFPRGTRLVLREATCLSADIRSRPRARLWMSAYRRFYPQADRIVCPSRATLEDLATVLRVPRARLCYIPNPVDPTRLEALAAEVGNPYAEGGPHVVTVGRLSREKGQARVLRAFAQLAPRLPEARLWLLGDGPLRAALEEEAQRLGLADRACFLGFVANPYPWVRHADVLVQASDREGSPNALLEALACRTSVVALDSPGGTREILEGQVGAALVAMNDEAALVEALARLLGPDRPPPPELPEEYAVARVTGAYARFFSSLEAPRSSARRQMLGSAP